MKQSRGLKLKYLFFLTLRNFLQSLYIVSCLIINFNFKSHDGYLKIKAYQTANIDL